MQTIVDASPRPLPSSQAPTVGDIRLQLDRVTASPEFSVTARGKAFLRYVVEESLAGRADRIKGYSIAIEVFDRDQNFQQDDPVVRIEAGRIRRALERYYLIAGQTDPVRIEIPKGRYVPVFAWNATGKASGDSTVHDEPAGPVAPQPRRLPFFLMAMAVLAAAIALGIFTWRDSFSAWFGDRVSSGIDTEGPTLIVAPFASLTDSAESRLYALGLTEELLSTLPRFKELAVFGRETSESLPPQTDASHAKSLGGQYLLGGSVQVSQDRIHVTSRLTDTGSGEILWSQTYDEDTRSRDIFAIQADIAAQVATAVAQPYGIIFHADALKAPPDDLEAYQCTLQFYAYRAKLSPAQHALVRVCLEQAVARFPSYGTAWSMLSILYVDEDRFGFNARAGSPTSLEKSLVAARRAVDLDPQNVRALQALMTSLFFNRQLAESMAVGEKALKLNPNDTEFLGEFGTRLASSGQWDRGMALLTEALSRNPGASGYYHAMLALTAYMKRDDKLALTEIQQADLQSFPIFHAIAAIIYAQNGMMDDAGREAQIFVTMRPKFMSNIHAELEKRHFRPEDQVRMIEGLRKAGLM